MITPRQLDRELYAEAREQGRDVEELVSGIAALDGVPPRFQTSPAQSRVVDLLRSGRRLFWFGDEGPEMSGESFWPQKRTVRAMLKSGLLRWLPYANPAQRECGVQELALSDAGRLTPTAKATKAEATPEAGQKAPQSVSTSRHPPA